MLTLILIAAAGLVLLSSSKKPADDPATPNPRPKPGSKLPPKPKPKPTQPKPEAPTPGPDPYEGRDDQIRQALCDLYAAQPNANRSPEWLRLFVAMNVYAELTWPESADDELSANVPIQQELLWEMLMLKVLRFYADPSGYCAKPVRNEPEVKWKHDEVYAAMCAFAERHPRTFSTLVPIERAYYMRAAIARSVYPNNIWPNDKRAAKVSNPVRGKQRIWDQLLSRSADFDPAAFCE